jgi:hypothetical protein
MDASAEGEPGEVEPTTVPDPEAAPIHEAAPETPAPSDEPEAVETPPEPDPADELRSQVQTLTAERDDALRRLAELESSEASARTQVGERDATIETLTAERDRAAKALQDASAEREALTAQWAAEASKAAIMEALKPFTFLGGKPEIQALYCRDFLRLAAPDVQAVRTKDGGWVVRAKDGRSVGDYVRAAVDDHAHLFARRGKGGVGEIGGNVPHDVAQIEHRLNPGSLEAIAARMKRNR